MKSKIILLLFLILTIQNGFSQSWSPFVFNQNSYYKQQYADSAKIENFFLDSTLITGNISTSYFNSKTSLKQECYNNIKEHSHFNFFKNPNKIDSLIKRNDSVLYVANYLNKQDTFIFKPYSKLNDEWFTNGITIKCSNLGVLNILGNTDSIKIFSCIGNNFDGIEFILSKTHGFIKFLPFDNFIKQSISSSSPQYFELIGYSKNNLNIGYTSPDFSNYFHLQNGDKLYWLEIINPSIITEPKSTTYHVDSITASYISPDSVHYDYKRISYNENGTVIQTGNYANYHLRKDEGVIVKNHTSWFGLKYKSTFPNEIYFLKSLYFKIENNDTVTYAEYDLNGLTIDTSSCSTGEIFDYGLSVKFSTREGKIYQGNYDWGEHSITLRGAIIDGLNYGNTNIPTGMTDYKLNKIKVSPNPFIDYITIDFPNNMISQIEIYNVIGNLILKQNTNTNKIYLNGLTSGIYILKIIDVNGRIKQTKIIK